MILCLHSGGAFGGQSAALATVAPEGHENQADLRGTAADARQGFAPRDRVVAGLGRMLPSRRFTGGPRGASRALGAMAVELLECCHSACVIQLSIRAQGSGGHSTQSGALVVWHAWALAPQGFHALLHARMRLMGAFVVQRLCVCLTEGKLEHPGGVLLVRRRMGMPHHRGCTGFSKAQTVTVGGIR